MTLTSEERSGRTTDFRIAGCDGVCHIRNGPGTSFDVLRFERDRLEVDTEPARRPILDGEVAREEEEGDECSSGEERPPPPECFWVGCIGERESIEVVLIFVEGVFGGTRGGTHGGGGG